MDDHLADYHWCRGVLDLEKFKVRSHGQAV